MAKSKDVPAGLTELPPEVPPELPGAPGGDLPAAPKFETPAVAAPADVPRVVKPIERAPGGLARFKVRALKEGEPYLYVLARDRASAERHYRKVQGLEKGEDGKDVPLAVRELPD